jgi:hypothetical protein
MKADFKALRSWTQRNHCRLAPLAAMMRLAVAAYAQVPGNSRWENAVNSCCVPLIGSRERAGRAICPPSQNEKWRSREDIA